MSGRSAAGAHLPVAYFTELASSSTLRLAAAVVFRGVPTEAALYAGGGPLGFLRAARHALWLQLGPLGADVSVAGRSVFGGTDGASRSVNSVGHLSLAGRLAYYDTGSRALRLLGRVVSAPSAATLVALVDAMGALSAAPRIVLREVRTPEVPKPTFDGYTSLPGEMVSYMVSGEQPEWESALRRDPIVQAFFESREVE